MGDIKLENIGRPTVAKTFNCPKCDLMYWAMNDAELAAYNSLSVEEQNEQNEVFILEHKKVCLAYRKN